MKFLLASAIAIIFSGSVYSDVEEAIRFAEEKILVFESHLQKLEKDYYGPELRIDFQYHNGYVNGALDAYRNMLKKIEQD